MLETQPFRFSFHCGAPSEARNAATSPRQLPTTTTCPHAWGRSDLQFVDDCCHRNFVRSGSAVTTYPVRSERLSKNNSTASAVKVILPKGTAGTGNSATVV